MNIENVPIDRSFNIEELSKRADLCCYDEIDDWHNNKDPRLKGKALRDLHHRSYLDITTTVCTPQTWSKIIEDDITADSPFIEDEVTRCIGFLEGNNIDLTPSDAVTSSIDVEQLTAKCAKYSKKSRVTHEKFKKSFQLLHGEEPDACDNEQNNVNQQAMYIGPGDYVWHPIHGQVRVNHQNRLPAMSEEEIIALVEGRRALPQAQGVGSRISHLHPMVEAGVPNNGAQECPGASRYPRPDALPPEVLAIGKHSVPYGVNAIPYGHPLYFNPPNLNPPIVNIGMNANAPPHGLSKPRRTHPNTMLDSDDEDLQIDAVEKPLGASLGYPLSHFPTPFGASTLPPGANHGMYGANMVRAPYPMPPNFSSPPFGFGAGIVDDRINRSKTAPHPSTSAVGASSSSDSGSTLPPGAYFGAHMNAVAYGYPMPPNFTSPPFGFDTQNGDNRSDNSNIASTSAAMPTSFSASALRPGASAGGPRYGLPMYYMPPGFNVPPLNIGAANDGQQPGSSDTRPPEARTSAVLAQQPPFDAIPPYGLPFGPPLGYPMFHNPANFQPSAAGAGKMVEHPPRASKSAGKPSTSTADANSEICEIDATANSSGSNSTLYDSLSSVSDIETNTSVSEAKNAPTANVAPKHESTKASSAAKTPAKANTSKDSFTSMIDNLNINHGEEKPHPNISSTAQKISFNAKHSVAFSYTARSGPETQKGFNDAMNEQLNDTHESKKQKVAGNKRRPTLSHPTNESDIDESASSNIVANEMHSLKRARPESSLDIRMDLDNFHDMTKQPTISEKLSPEPVSGRIPDHLRLPCKPSKFVNTYKSIIVRDNMNAEDDSNFGRNNDSFKENQAKPNQYVANEPPTSRCDFKTGTEELKEQYAKKYGNPGTSSSTSSGYTGGKTLGARAGRTVRGKFVPPVYGEQNQHQHQQQPQRSNSSSRGQYNNQNAQQQTTSNYSDSSNAMNDDERLKNIDPLMIERIQNEIMHHDTNVGWDSIAGLNHAKRVINEAIIFPITRPDIFKGLRRPPKGILLFGPPGTGKTMIGKCIASQANATFFSISASSLTSKWIGEGEKMVRALFAVATVHQPSVIFIDEIDSLLSQRSETEHESSRRLKTEFLVQLDGATTSEDDRVIIVGATNRPQELDEAARRRLVKRLYIPLPEHVAREQMIRNLLKSENVQMQDHELEEVVRRTDGYSGADMKALCSEAAMGPIRGISGTSMFTLNQEDVRPINFEDFADALKCVKATVSQKDLNVYAEWDETFGSGLGK